MEKMERKFIRNAIPIWEWKDIPLVRIGKEEYITVKPFNFLNKNIRNLGQAKEIAKQFSEKYDCYATVSYDTDWIKLYQFLEANHSRKAFLYENRLDIKEALLLDSNSEGETHVLAAGSYHCLNEIFRGFISGDDCDGEPQPEKLVFLTIKISE